jgi:hypothetical protein
VKPLAHWEDFWLLGGVPSKGIETLALPLLFVSTGHEISDFAALLLSQTQSDRVD